MNGSLLAAIIYLSLAVCLAGTAWRGWVWLRAPVPLMIPLTPAPGTKTGVAVRLAGEALGFHSLFRADRGLWALAWIFHASLAGLLIGHVAGLLTPDVSARLLGLSAADYDRVAQVTGSLVGAVALVSLAGLFGRRVASIRLRYISSAADYFLLVLLFLIVGTGLAMRLSDRFDLASARAFVSSVIALQPDGQAVDLRFAVHVLLVCGLLVYAPFSKLGHMAGIFLNPALNQTNTPREQRHVGPLGNASA